MQTTTWTRHTIFVAAALFWLLPGHFLLSENTTGPVDVTALLMLALTWLVCYVSSTDSPRAPVRSRRNFTYAFLALAALSLSIHLCTANQGLKAKYYSNPDFQPPVETSWKFGNPEYTRIDPQINFRSSGFSFVEQYFPLHFSNNWSARQWKENQGNTSSAYLFSAEWSGKIFLPKDVTSLALRAGAGEALLTFDGVPYPDGEVSGIGTGQHEITVRYARKNQEPPRLSLQWLREGKWITVPAQAFSQKPFAAILLSIQLGIFVCWLSILGYLAWHEKVVKLISYRTFLWIVFVAIVADSASALIKQGGDFGFQIFVPGNDWLLYETLARDILQGDWLTTQEMPFITMNFGYRYILAFLHQMAGEAPADVILLQLACMALLIAVTAGFIARHWSVVGSLIFVVIVVWSNQVVKFAEPLLDTTWAMISGMLVLYGLYQFSATMNRKWIVLTGIALGTGVLIRTNFLPFLAVATLWVWFSDSRGSWQTKAANVAILIALVIGLMSLIGLRNHVVAGEWRWFPASGLPNLWIGNHPPEFNGPTYFVVKWMPAEHDILNQVVKYIYADPLAMAQRILDKSLYILGIDQETLHNFSGDAKEGFKVKPKVLLPWLLAITGTVSLWIYPYILRRRELILLWAWIAVVNLPLAILFFPWGYGWRLSGPSFLPIYLIGAIAIHQWYFAAHRFWSEKHSAEGVHG